MTNQSNGKLRMGMPGLEPLTQAAHLATFSFSFHYLHLVCILASEAA